MLPGAIRKVGHVTWAIDYTIQDKEAFTVRRKVDASTQPYVPFSEACLKFLDFDESLCRERGSNQNTEQQDGE
jgi:hypothetical protein